MDALTRDQLIAGFNADAATPELIISTFYRRAQIEGAVIDGGANIGYHTKQLAALEGVTQVFAVEPCRSTHAILAEKATGWPGAAKIVLVEAALQSDPEAESVRFFTSADHPGRNGINPIMRLYDTQYEACVEVPATTLDKVAARAIDRVAFIKLDLEGNEYDALKGGREVLSSHRPAVVFENGVEAPAMNGYTVDEMLRFWADVGYVPVTALGERMDEVSHRTFWYAWAFPAEDADRLTRRLLEATREALGLTQ